jgi:hypothetical protein
MPSSAAIFGMNSRAMLARYAAGALALSLAVLAFTSYHPRPALRRSAPAAVTRIFDDSDRDGDGYLSRTEFAAAAAEGRGAVEKRRSQSTTAPAQVQPVHAEQPVRPQPPPEVSTPLRSAALAPQQPQCSILFFYHIARAPATEAARSAHALARRRSHSHGRALTASGQDGGHHNAHRPPASGAARPL